MKVLAAEGMLCRRPFFGEFGLTQNSPASVQAKLFTVEGSEENVEIKTTPIG